MQANISDTALPKLTDVGRVAPECHGTRAFAAAARCHNDLTLTMHRANAAHDFAGRLVLSEVNTLVADNHDT